MHTTIIYAGMLGEDVDVYQEDSAFLSTFDPQESSFKSTSTTRAYEASTYVPEYSTIENIHTCIFVAKIHTITLDNPKNGEVLKKILKKVKFGINFHVVLSFIIRSFSYLPRGFELPNQVIFLYQSVYRPQLPYKRCLRGGFQSLRSIKFRALTSSL